MAMDTSPSSASLSASDSGEEEVIGSVTRAHQQTFMYNQDQGSLTGEAPPPSGLQDSGTAKNTANQQDTWNNHNNLVSLEAQDPSNLGPQGPEDGPFSFRPSRSSAPSHCPAYTHGAFRNVSNECPVNGGHARALWRGGNRMHLVGVMMLMLVWLFKHFLLIIRVLHRLLNRNLIQSTKL